MMCGSITKFPHGQSKAFGKCVLEWKAVDGGEVCVVYKRMVPKLKLIRGV